MKISKIIKLSVIALCLFFFDDANAQRRKTTRNTRTAKSTAASARASNVEIRSGAEKVSIYR